MSRLIGAVLATGLVLGLGSLAQADDAKATVDKAIKALGGADKLAAIKVANSKIKGKLFLGGDESEFTTQLTTQGIDHFRQEFEGNFGGNPVKGITVLAGDKGWRKFGERSGKMEDEALANEKRIVYLQVVAATVLPLTDKGFKVESAPEEKIDGKSAVVLKATGPDGKTFQMSFDKESGLPVKQTATVLDFQGNEFAQEMRYSNYKDFGGVKRATKIEAKRDGDKFIEMEITELKFLDKAEPKTFDEP